VIPLNSWPISADTLSMKKPALFSLILIGVTVFLAAQTANSELFRQEGIASWYGREFEGRPTASGEIFNPAQYTAAHPTLPFGTMLTVTNRQNNRQVTVRVNDRGPFVAARIIDLSMAAAEVLDMIGTGTAPVIVESAVTTTLGPVTAPQPAAPAAQPTPPPAQTPPVVAQTPPVTTPPVTTPPVATPPVTTPPVTTPPVTTPPVTPSVTTPPVATQPSAPPVSPAYIAPPAVVRGGIPPAGSANLYRIQVGSFRVPRNAVDVFDRLKAVGLNPRYEQYEDLYRVVLPELKAADIPAIAQTLGNAGFNEVLLRMEN